jgi:hypothetical protein
MTPPVQSFTIERAGFIPLAYRLGLAETTGVLTVTEVGTVAQHVAWLRRGAVTRIVMDDAAWAPLGQAARDALASGRGPAVRAALGRHVEQRLERLAAMPAASATLERVLAEPAGAQAQVSLALWARRHAEARLDATRMLALETELHGVRLSVAKHLLPRAGASDDDPEDDRGMLADPAGTGTALCDATDLRIIRALASPRRIDELERASRAPRFRLLAFVHFLRTVGALQEGGVAARHDHASTTTG